MVKVRRKAFMSKKYKNSPLVEAPSELNFAPETSQDFDLNRKSDARIFYREKNVAPASYEG